MRFFFDFLSPYSYLAWKRIHALAERHGRAVEPVPVLLAALLDHHGTQGPAEVPAKRVYAYKNLVRIAAREGLPFVPPPTHPFKPVAALSVAALDHPDRRRIVDVLFDATWAGGPGVADEPTVARVLSEAGFDGDALVAASRAVRGRLRSHTADAVAAGVFGVPTVQVEGEIFWGFDAFPDLDTFLAGRDPVDPAGVARWLATPAAATRGGPHHGLTHLSLGVADPERSAAFYAALGYTPYARGQGWVQVVRPGGREVLAFERSDRAGQRGGVDHFGFRLREPAGMDPVLAALVAAGGTVDRRGEFAPGLPFAYVTDPDGYTLEIWFE